MVVALQDMTEHVKTQVQRHIIQTVTVVKHQAAELPIVVAY
jgi:hypothetical protein